MKLRKAVKKAAKLKLGVSGTAGSGKTYGSLQLAHGLTGDWDKIALIDTENRSGDLYADLGSYNVLTLQDFSPNSYIEAIQACEEAGMEVIIIDSITHEWQWCLEYQTKLGGKYQDWGIVKPLHNKFKQAILQSSCHIICTVRRKTEYGVESGNEGKLKITKLGTKEITENEWEYELTVNFEVDQSHMAIASKDRTRLFVDGEPRQLSSLDGEKLLKWSSEGSTEEALLQAALIDISNCKSLDNLNKVYAAYDSLKGNSDFMNSLKETKKQFINKV